MTIIIPSSTIVIVVLLITALPRLPTALCLPGTISFSPDGGASFRGPIQSDTGQSTFDDIQVHKDVLVSNSIGAKSAKIHAFEAKDATVRSTLKVMGSFNVTSDATIVGRLDAKSSLGARSIQSHSIDSNSILVAQLDVTEKMRVKGTFHAEEGDFGKEVRANRDLVVRGTLRCTGKESLVTNGNAQMKALDAGSVTAKLVQVGHSLETPSLRVVVAGKGGGGGKLDVIDGTIRGGRISSTESMSTNAFQCENATVRGGIQTQNLTVREFAQVRYVNVSAEANVRQLHVDSMTVHKKLSVVGGPIVAVHGVQSKMDCRIDGTLISTKGRFQDEVVVNGVLTGQEIVAKKNITTGTLISNNVDIKSGSAMNFNVEHLDSGIVLAQSMSVNQSLTTKGQFVALHNASVNGVLSVHGKVLTSSSIQSEGDITSQGHLRSKKNILAGENITVERDLVCHGAIHTPMASITDTLSARQVLAKEMHVSGVLMSNEARFGVDEDSNDNNAMMTIQSGTIAMSAKLVGGNASFDGMVHMDNVTAFSVSVEGELVTQHLSSKNTIVVSNGDLNVTKGTVRASNAEISGDLVSNGTVHASNLLVSELMSESVHVQGTMNASSVSATSATFNDTTVHTLNARYVDIHGNLTMAKGSELSSETIITQSLHADAVEVRNGLKATSFIGKRIYTEDITSNGFVTVQDMKVKGNVMATGNLEIEGTVTMNTVLNANIVNVENSLEATTAKFGGFVEAGGMQVRKLQVVGELYLNGINVGDRLNEMNDLERRLEALEKLVANL